MEYMNNIENKLTSIDETNIKYFDLFEFPELFYGNLNFTTEKLCISKFPKEILEEMKEWGELIHTGINYYNDASCGNRLRFITSSSRIVFKVQLKRKWPFQKIVNWGSMGFDVYILENEKYIHKTIFAPMDGYNIFAEEIYIKPNEMLCIFLPNYNIIEKMYVGIQEGSTLSKFDYPKDNQLPIIFYGNSITQGAAASKTGNSFPNIVSRKLNRDIINISSSSGCLGTESIANLIGKLNCHSIVIDYTKMLLI
ncbi:SGNH/GDSL hydrolase family protein [Methanobrevibacter gottschalkii]|uniref:SGNH/GDSL hydrolase family protein n=1 Tax=Methanobrevibacter gottschalkii TaxID=190974 RepID=UPI0038D10238